MIWSFYYNLAEAVELVDFKCNFDKEGLCRMRQNYRKDSYYTRRKRWVQMCCCSGCHGEIGYLRTLPNSSNAIYEIASSFDSGRWKRGFWRPKIGCLLPWKFRSITCLTHHCSHGMDWKENERVKSPRLTKAEQNLLDGIYGGPRWLIEYSKKMGKRKGDVRGNVQKAIDHLIITLRKEKGIG
jgi:hypothetical protein